MYDSIRRMRFYISCKSGKPIYLQLVDQVRTVAASGAMQQGTRLPSIRVLAKELGINRNTISKAFSVLETLGVIETVKGKGCFVKKTNSPSKKETARKILTEEINQTVVQAYHLSIPDEEFLGIVRRQMAAVKHQRR